MSHRRPNVGPVTRRLNKLSALQALESTSEEGNSGSDNESDRSSSYAGSEGSSDGSSSAGSGRQTSENDTLTEGSAVRGESTSSKPPSSSSRRRDSWAYDNRQWKEQMLDTMAKAAVGVADGQEPSDEPSLDQAVAHQAQTQGLLRSRLIELNQVLLEAEEAVSHIKKREKECLKAGEKVRSILESTHKRLQKAKQFSEEMWPVEYEMVREPDMSE